MNNLVPDWHLVPNWLPDLLSFVGGLILLIPALRLNKLSKTRHLFESLDDDQRLKGLRDYIKKRKEKVFLKQFEWSPKDEFILLLGLGLSILGSFLNFITKL